MSSNPPEADDPWQGSESGCWKSHGGEFVDHPGRPAAERAPHATPKTLALVLEGTDREATRADVEAALRGRFRLVEPAKFTAALAAEGQRTPLGPALTLPWQRARALALYDPVAAPYDPTFYADKLVTGRFFVERVLPDTGSHLAKLKTGSATMMALAADRF